MVIGMEESEWLLLEDEKDSIDEFEVFGQVVHLRKSEKLRKQAQSPGLT